MEALTRTATIAAGVEDGDLDGKLDDLIVRSLEDERVARVRPLYDLLA